MSSKTTNAPLPDGLEIAGYRIVRKISSGGFSFVYLAYDEDNNPVAIKEYLPSSLASRDKGTFIPSVKPEHLATYRVGLRCFFEEGRVLAKIFHENVVRVVNFFRANETVYMVMNYETGRALQELILKFRDRGDQEVLTESFIREIFMKVLDGLKAVHAQKMLHLDLKPANIYLRKDGAPILLDFGAARTTVNMDASKLFPMYTPGFAPPEMYSKRDISPATDLYSIGACMFACMAGIPPQPSDIRLKNDRMEAAYKALRGIYSDQLISVVRWCMKLDAKARPVSVDQLQRVLKAQGKQVTTPSQMQVLVNKIKFWLRGGKRSKAFALIKADNEQVKKQNQAKRSAPPPPPAK